MIEDHARSYVNKDNMCELPSEVEKFYARFLTLKFGFERLKSKQVTIKKITTYDIKNAISI